MERIDFIKEKILQLEDYEQVDAALMSEINSNPEYLHLFDECKALSGFIKKSVPAPVYNGLSLSESIVQKVRNGDTAPKYINSHNFRFPFATVACLLIVCAVIFTSRYMPDKYSRDYDTQNNMAAESHSDEETVFDAKLIKSKDKSLMLDATSEEIENESENITNYSLQASDDDSYYYTVNTPEEPEAGETLQKNDAIYESNVRFESALERFSFEEETEIYIAGAPGVKTDGFKNITENPVTNKATARELAKNECTISYDTVKTFFDEEMEIWKVVFMTDGTLGNCQAVYLDKFGMTHLIVYGE